MGEPSLNMAVLDVLEELPRRYRTPSLMPSISTIAPLGADPFFERLIEIKDRLYSNGNFQFQFSIHTTDIELRDRLIPVRKWDFARMASYGAGFYKSGDRKITLNFALAVDSSIDSHVLLRYFDPARYLIKLTPVNPTSRAAKNKMDSFIDPARPDTAEAVTRPLQEAGYDVIVSIGEVEENEIGSNCGQYVLNYLESGLAMKDGYSYQVKTLVESPIDGE
jgi:23S rRNA (adenine2503-C2)-methyltransferase